jgi:hypothetical protein
MSKPTASSVDARVTALNAMVELLSKAIDSQGRQIRHLMAKQHEIVKAPQSQDLPEIPDYLTGSARKRAEESLQRRLALRAKGQRH